MSDVSPELKKLILPTDSRRRLDIRYLIKGEDKRATAWKQIGENKQREEEKELKSKTGKDEVTPSPVAITYRLQNFWDPIWFKLNKDHQDKDFWFFTDSFWEEREKREKEIKEGKDVEVWTGVLDLTELNPALLCPKCKGNGR